MVRKYQELATKEELSASEKLTLKSLTEKLIKLVPDLKGVIDDETKSYEEQETAINKIINGFFDLLKKLVS